MTKIVSKNSRKYNILCLGILILLINISGLYSEPLYIEDAGFVLEPPVGWEILEIADSKWTFQDFTGEAFLQLKIFPGDSYESVSELSNAMMDKIQAKGDSDTFDFYGRDAVFATLDFNAGGSEYSGYGFFAEGDDFDLAILSFASNEHTALLNDYIISALDSFALSPVFMNNPGPVSSYYQQSYGEAKTTGTELIF